MKKTIKWLLVPLFCLAGACAQTSPKEEAAALLEETGLKLDAAEIEEFVENRDSAGADVTYLQVQFQGLPDEETLTMNGWEKLPLSDTDKAKLTYTEQLEKLEQDETEKGWYHLYPDSIGPQESYTLCILNTRTGQLGLVKRAVK